MFHAPKRPCSYGGIIYSFFRICQHVFLNFFSLADSVPIIKQFSLYWICRIGEGKNNFNWNHFETGGSLLTQRGRYENNWIKKL